MDETLRGQIKDNLSTRETGELVNIWKEQNSDEWEQVTFEIIKEILFERLGEVPEIPIEKVLSSLFTRLEECLKEKDYQQGLSESEEAVRLAPDNAQIYNYRGLFFDYLGQKENALKDYEEAVRLDPDFEGARENLNSLKNELSENLRVHTSESPTILEGNNSLESTIRNNFNIMDIDELVDIWQVHDTDEWTELAFKVLRQILLERLGEIPEFSVENVHPGLFTGLEECLKNKDYQRGLRESEEAVRLSPDNAQAYNYRGLFNDYLGQTEKAFQDYKEAVRLDPDFEDARANRDSLQNELAEKARGNTQIPVFLDSDNSLDANIRNNFMLMETDQLVEIWRIQDTREWTELAFNILRQVLIERLGNVPEIYSSSSLEKGKDTRTKSGDKNNKPDVLSIGEQVEIEPVLNPELSEIADMPKQIKRNLDIQFDNPSANKYLAIAESYAEDEDFDLAQQAIEKAKPLLPESAVAFTDFGEVCLRARRPDEAFDAFEKAIELDPDYSRARTGRRNAWVMMDAVCLNSEVKPDPSDLAAIESQANEFNEEEFEKNQDNLEDTPDWVFMDKEAIQVKGSAGHRNRAGRSGFDPIDTQMDSYRFQGGLIRRLFTGHLRTHDPLYLIFMFIIGSLFLLPLLSIITNSDFFEQPIEFLWANALLIPFIVAGLAIIYNFIQSFFSEEPEGFEDTNDKFF